MSQRHPHGSPADTSDWLPFQPPDLTGFLGGHAIMRAQFALLARAAGEVSATDTKRLAALDSHLAFVTRRLTQHHTAEDDSIWPQLRHADASLMDLLDDLEQDHHRLDQLLDATGNRSVPLPRRAAALRDLHRDLTGHLDREEAHAVPAIRRLIPQSAWALEDERFQRELGADRTTTLVWILSHLPPEPRRAMLAELPRPVRVLYKSVWRPKHRRQLVLLYGKQATRGA
jgi:hypothetical protein